MKIIYTPKALEDLVELKQDLIDQWGETTTLKILKNITKGINQLEEFPLSGVSLGNFINAPTKYRYLFTEKNYIFYQMDSHEIQVIRVLHEKQDFIRQLFD